jgi:hypothetical protein
VTRLYVLVEGLTEETFVRSVLARHLVPRNIWVFPLVVETSRDAAGRKRRGGGGWKQWLRDLKRLTGEQSGNEVWFTTMFDLYGLPVDFPERSEHDKDQDTARRADKLTDAMARAIGDRRVIPYLQRHEFEALVLASVDNLARLFEGEPDATGVENLRADIRGCAPEDINDGDDTAPSKRLARHVPTYQKTVHGPEAVAANGLDALRRTCPRFDAWVSQLEALGASEA